MGSSQPGREGSIGELLKVLTTFNIFTGRSHGWIHPEVVKSFNKLYIGFTKLLRIVKGLNNSIKELLKVVKTPIQLGKT